MQRSKSDHIDARVIAQFCIALEPELMASHQPAEQQSVTGADETSECGRINGASESSLERVRTKNPRRYSIDPLHTSVNCKLTLERSK